MRNTFDPLLLVRRLRSPGPSCGLGLALGLVLAHAPSCGGGTINGSHCSFLTGDAVCAALYPSGVLPYCGFCGHSPHGNGCVAERPEDACYSPCGKSLTAVDVPECADEATSTDTLDADASTGTGTPTTAAVDESTGTSTTATTASGCAGDDPCTEPAPFCVDGECVPCSLAPDPSAACQSLDPTRPLCVDDRCVACTAKDATACEGLTPVCDVPSGTCVGCSYHEQCPASACHIEEGSCLPADRVWHVDGDAASCAAADGSLAAPYCTVGAALVNVGPGETGTLLVHARTGDAAYAGGFTITGGRVVAVRGMPDERPRFSGGGVGAPVTVTSGAVAYLDRGRVDGSTLVEAVQVVGAVLYLDGWLVVLNQGGGVSLSNGATLSARTTVIGANGSGLADAQALRVTDASFSLRYVTLAGNDGVGVASILCTGASEGSLGNSIVVAIEPSSIDCRGLVVEHSAIDSSLDGDGVVLHDSFDAGWFTAPGAGDFHLEPGHPFDDVAEWQVGDPLVDLDGDERPGIAGSPDVAGADL